MIAALSIIAYFTGAGLTLGYVRAILDDDNWEHPITWIGSIFWPISVAFLLVAMPLQRLGFFLGNKQIDWQKQREQFKKKRIAIQKQIKSVQDLELQEAEKELEDLLSKRKTNV